MILDIARQALKSWNIMVVDIALIAQRENIVLKVTDNNGSYYALRLHRPNYQSNEAILSELKWLLHLHHEGLQVPKPVASGDGSILVNSNGYSIDLLTWLYGRQLGVTGEPLDLLDRQSTFYSIGETMARIHLASDNWLLPEDFERNK